MKPTAYEWHNESTGHCYVDYVPHNLMDENNGYVKTPLYKIGTKTPINIVAERLIYIEGLLQGMNDYLHENLKTKHYNGGPG